MVENGGAHAIGAAADAANEVVSPANIAPSAATASPLRRKLWRWERPRPFLAFGGLVVSLFLATALLLLMQGADKDRAGAVAVTSPITYHELPELLADLKRSHTRQHYVRLTAVVEVTEENIFRLQTEQAHIVADALIALRDLQRQDLAGAAGVERLRGMFTGIVDRHIAPASARSVLFIKFLVD